MDKKLYPTHPVRVLVAGPSECGKSCTSKNLILNNIKDFGKIYVYSPSLHEQFYQKLFNCYNNITPIKVFQDTLKEEDLDYLIEGLVNNENFEKSEREKESFETVE